MVRDSWDFVEYITLSIQIWGTRSGGRDTVIPTLLAWGILDFEMLGNLFRETTETSYSWTWGARIVMGARIIMRGTIDLGT